MRLSSTGLSSLRLFGVVLGSVVAIGLGLVIGLSASGVLAEGGTESIYACVSSRSGTLRIVSTLDECKPNETPLSWTGGFDATALEARVATLAGQVSALQDANATQQSTIASLTTQVSSLASQVTALDARVPACLTTVGNDAVFDGCNVQILNGDGRTATANGKGNLIVGYNEALPGSSRSGSHNVVVGADHSYGSFGGLVAGYNNTISGPFASVSGGSGNVAGGVTASVSGGVSNTANGPNASISGGSSNTASGSNASVSGGSLNFAGGPDASVGGGIFNTASGPYASVSGGLERSAAGEYDWAAGGLFEDY